MSNLVKQEEGGQITASSTFTTTIDSSDIDIPRINVVQKTSDIYGPDGEPAPFGSLVLDKTWILAGPEEQIRAIPVVASKGWREDIPFDADEVPRLAFSEDERHQLSLDSEYDLLEFAEITLLFKGNEEDDNAFPYPIGEDYYAMGKINVAKDAYRQTFKRLFTFAKFNRNTPLHSREWNFKSTMLSRGKYSWYAPQLGVSSDASSEAVMDFVDGFLLP